MEIFNELNENFNLSLALGFFDGVHLGHQKVLKSAVEYAKLNNTKSAVITFQEHPCCYLWNIKPKYILTREERQNKIRNLGIDYLYELDFSKYIDMSAEEYLKKIIIDYYRPCAICTGFNHYFGKNKLGTPKLLAVYEKIYDYKYVSISAERTTDGIISSTEIRNSIKTGDIIAANMMLGYKFFICGPVIEGQKIGRKIGYRTANQIYPSNLIDLPYGVYATWVYVNGKKYSGVTNFGIKPTVSDNIIPTLETHILNFESNIYGSNVKLEFLYMIRNEQKFDTIEELIAQINLDIMNVKMNEK